MFTNKVGLIKEKRNTAFSILLLALLFAPLFGGMAAKALDTKLDVSLHNVTVTERPAFSLQTYLDKSFQTEFNAYFESSFTFRNFLVRCRNQFRYDVFGTGLIYHGKDGYLFGPQYIEEYLGISSTVQDDYLVRLTDKLAHIQETIKNSGRDFVVVVTPQKADFYPDKIRDGYYWRAEKADKNAQRYDRFVELLEEKGICHVDSYSVLNQETASYPIFYKTGDHWSMPAALDVTIKLLNTLKQNGSFAIKNIWAEDMTASETPLVPEDIDLYNLSNKFKGEMDPFYYYPQTGSDSSAPTPNILIQGGSFTNAIIKILREEQVFNVRSIFYTYTFTDYNGQQTHVDNYDGMDIEQLVNDCDILLIEINPLHLTNMESYLTGYLSGLIEEGYLPTDNTERENEYGF